MLKKGRLKICKDAVLCDNIFQKGFGLMFKSRNSVKDTAWVFRFGTPRRIHVTMWFVFFPIDLIFLDVSGRVVETAKVKPFSLYHPKNKACTLIECEYGIVVKKKIRKGDILSW